MFQLRRFHVALACLVVFTACTKSDAPPRSKEMPGALTKPLSSYSGDEFYALVTRLSYAGAHERDRRCVNAPGCEGTPPTKLVKVQVEAIATQDSIAPANATTNGVVYVRALNRGDAEEARYHLAPGAQFQYFVIVNAPSADAMQWTLVQLDTTSKARRLSTLSTGKFTPCNHPWVAGAQADFKTCERARSARDSIVTLGLALQTFDNDPIWATCSTGCCIVE